MVTTKTNIVKRGAIALLAIVVLLGYGGACNLFPKKDDSGSSAARVAATVIIVDPYIKGARVFEDKNNNGVKENDEQESTVSDDNGRAHFSNQLTTTSTIRMSPSITGTHNGVPFTGTLKSKVEVITTTPYVVSPITTLLANGWTKDQVRAVLSANGITLDEADLTQDPMAGLEIKTALADTDLAKLKASMAISSMMEIVDSLPGVDGYAITYDGYTAITQAAPALQKMAEVIKDYCLSPTLLTTVGQAMETVKAQIELQTGGAVTLPPVNASDIIRSATTIANYVISQIDENNPATYTLNQAQLAQLGARLGLNYYLNRNKDNPVIKFAPLDTISSIPGVVSDFKTFSTLEINPDTGGIDGKQ
ncbi:MAG: hypothetical protein QME51_08815 [Planctomycetota bacterium]|nr:hypothetical protein [Planctomycetota bacterium]